MIKDYAPDELKKQLGKYREVFSDSFSLSDLLVVYDLSAKAEILETLRAIFGVCAELSETVCDVSCTLNTTCEYLSEIAEENAEKSSCDRCIAGAVDDVAETINDRSGDIEDAIKTTAYIMAARLENLRMEHKTSGENDESDDEITGCGVSLSEIEISGDGRYRVLHAEEYDPSRGFVLVLDREMEENNGFLEVYYTKTDNGILLSFREDQRSDDPELRKLVERVAMIT